MPRYLWLAIRNREYRGLVLAQISSEIGDHFARWALAALVLDRSDSVFYAALAFVVGHIPGVLGGILLSPFADRLPRKQVMILCDLARAGVVAVLALIAVETTPLWVFFVLLLTAELFSQPFGAARQATLPDVLPDPQDYLSGAALMRGLFQINQVIGVAVAGVVVVAFSPRTALVIDAMTFLVSYLCLQWALAHRPAPLEGRGGVRGFLQDTAEGIRMVFGHTVRRYFVLIVWATIGLLIAPEAVALAHARGHGAPSLGGVMFAAVPAGGAVGVLVLSRLDPVRAARLTPLLAALSFVPLVMTFVDPGPGPTIVLWFLSGCVQAFVVAMIVGVNLVTPIGGRGRVNGVAGAGLSLFTALGFALTGWLADVTSPAVSVGMAGVAGLLIVAWFAPRWPAAIHQFSQHLASTSDEETRRSAA